MAKIFFRVCFLGSLLIAQYGAILPMKKCFFCSVSAGKENIEILHSGKYVFVINDGYPVTKHHSLVITKRHVSSYFDITDEELLEINKFINIRKKQILKEDSTVKGFNVGVNIGKAAGQSIFHVHVHLIPRRFGDLENPKGGVRGVIPEKRNYQSEN
jgi:diadenosine tetraphosphate (Ap4A) HIT family hydrolase